MISVYQFVRNNQLFRQIITSRNYSQSLCPCLCQLKRRATNSTSVLMKEPQVDGHHGESWRGNLSRARWLPILVTDLVAPILARLLPPYHKILIFRVKCLRNPTTKGRLLPPRGAFITITLPRGGVP